jgi:GNAT superfamily N-acetyltransferase
MNALTIELVEPDNPEHACSIVRLLDEYAGSPEGGGAGLSEFTKVNLPRELAKRAGTQVILAFIDGEAAGMIIAFEGFSTFQCRPLLNIHDVIVSSRYRGQGLSKWLLAKAEEVASDRGCCKLTLEVLEGNPIARTAYRTCGFESYQLDPEMGVAQFWEKKLL